MALDSSGRRLLVTSGSVRSPIYQVFTFPPLFLHIGRFFNIDNSNQMQGDMPGFRTLPHSGPITSVDWHPTLPIFVTGSADYSVRVTSMIWCAISVAFLLICYPPHLLIVFQDLPLLIHLFRDRKRYSNTISRPELCDIFSVFCSLKSLLVIGPKKSSMAMKQ